ncbi:MAG: hypothetical protein GX372_08885 [Ignavibacteria bacterium]|jgi:flagellar hook-associated protein 3 FlgL|nr:hypothetical protein [Ignavibacteria bacterium]
MRISSNMSYDSFAFNIEKLQESRYKNLLRQSTGKDMINIADKPGSLMDVKKIVTAQEQRSNYINLNNLAASEMRAAEDQAEAVITAMQKIRDLSITSTNMIYDGSGVQSIGNYIKGIVTDILRNVNADFNGKYLFSGTKTNANSIEADNPGMNEMPFELIKNEASADNPSGFQVVFKGNMEQRKINKDTHSTEIINLTADELFGENGTKTFEAIIDIYNILLFGPDNTERENLESLSREEKIKIAELQQKVAHDLEEITKNNAKLASRRERLETVTEQMTEEVVRLKEVQSLREDADVVKVLSDLKKEETVLQYVLQSAPRLTRLTLFDFLS